MSTVPQSLTLHPQYFSVIGEVAECAREKLPGTNGRLIKAVQIALSGGVRPSELVRGGYRVASQSTADGYEVADNACTCPDYQRRLPTDPELVCKHLLASWLYRRAVQRLAALDAEAPAPEPGCALPVDADGTPCHTAAGCTHQQAAPPLPEAAASANVYILVHGHRVQLTLRGHQETDVLARLERVLTQYAPASSER